MKDELKKFKVVVTDLKDGEGVTFYVRAGDHAEALLKIEEMISNPARFKIYSVGEMRIPGPRKAS